MNKMEKMQEDIRLLQRQMTNYACSNIKNRKYGFKKHIYEEGDCFRFSDNSSHKLINNGYDEGLLVSLVKDGISWGKLFALNNKIVEDQVEFEKYLKDCRLTYIGIVDKVYFKIRRIS